MTDDTCSVDGCTKPRHARGYCVSHYSRWRYGRDVDTPLRPIWKTACIIEGCERKVRARGWCGAHYMRWKKHGDPLGGGPTPAGRGRVDAFVAQAAAYEGDDCLLWPYGKTDNGYGMARLDGKPIRAHRAVLIVAAGPPPFPRADAAHAPIICHNRACVNPRHLRWATRAENIEDAKLDGTFPGRQRRAAAG